MFLQLHSMRPHASPKNTGSNRETRNVLPRPTYSPEVAPSDVLLSGALQHAIRGKTFRRNDEVIENVAAGTKFKMAQVGDRYSWLSQA